MGNRSRIESQGPLETPSAKSTSKLRITIVGLNYSPEPTGNAPYTTSLAEGLAAGGHDVQVITGVPHYPEWRLRDGYGSWSKNEVINGVRVKRLRHHVPLKPSIFHRMHMELSFGVRAMFSNWADPDFVLVVSPALFSSGLVVLRAHLQRGRPSVGIWVQDIYSRGIIETGTGNSVSARAMSRLESWILRASDGVVVIHDRFARYVVGTLRVSQDKVRVIRNWTHLPPSPSSGRAEMREKLGWSETDIVVLHAGNMGKKQGLENVIDAARVSASRDSRVRFVLMGDGNQRRQLETTAYGVSRLNFVDPLPGEDFQLALASADILLVNELPGVQEMAVPSKLTSYFNAGRPVIAATDEQSVTASELSASGGGVRVDPADPVALVEAAEALGENPLKRAELGKLGLLYRHETLAEAAAIGHYDDFITSLAPSRSR
ncbi:glycosyltransferase [Arthrobacter sp. ZGTC131]|uniref:glycosyltransferase n=1 Tax=Arthrobacter sp. ZGTC131 TaxID=2058898 RepID=UPI000CE3B836|nr:glycosyltransferase [Arthrobacter sp. ZGTC131]